MPIRHDDPRPPYIQLAAELREAIERGEYQPGDRLPSRRQLASENGIAQMTVQHALDVLAEEGRVVAQHGRGVFVQDTTTSSSPDPEPDAPGLEEALDRALKDLAAANDRLARYEATYPEPPTPEPHEGPGIDH